MKKIVLLVFVFFSFMKNVGAFTRDSAKYSFFRDLSVSTVWFEAGSMFPIKEKKLLSLPNGMDKYLYSTDMGLSFGFFSIGLYYKDKMGVEILYRASDLSLKDSDFKNYLSGRYPNNYIGTGSGSNYGMEGLAYRVCYKFHLKYFQMEPKFQVGFNGFHANDNLVILKEKGSNQFIEYSIQKENLKKNNIDYHLILDISKRLRVSGAMKMELGFKTELMIMPTYYKYTISEAPYGGVGVVNQVMVRQNYPAWGIEAVGRFYFKK